MLEVTTNDQDTPKPGLSDSSPITAFKHYGMVVGDDEEFKTGIALAKCNHGNFVVLADVMRATDTEVSRLATSLEKLTVEVRFGAHDTQHSPSPSNIDADDIKELFIADRDVLNRKIGGYPDKLADLEARHQQELESLRVSLRAVETTITRLELGPVAPLRMRSRSPMRIPSTSKVNHPLRLHRPRSPPPVILGPVPHPPARFGPVLPLPRCLPRNEPATCAPHPHIHFH
ncbi:hypothetical protein K438DRAFT_1991957 [Mycena galopus ATCC 62051]|nr:hypothetical protein K438DRAFT_1991957 [Mycena galopus ATCC 62051]